MYLVNHRGDRLAPHPNLGQNKGTIVTITASTTTSTLAGFMAGRTWIGHADEAHTYEGAVPREDALQLLSFPVAEGTVDTRVVTEDGVHTFSDPDRKTVVRVDTGAIFGLFKRGYVIHQFPEWLVSNVDVLLDGGLQIGTVAVTKGGARAMVQAELPEGRIATAPGAEPVAHRPHITAATSHDGTIATTYGVGTRVLICENELSTPGAAHGIFRQGTGTHKIRHSSGSALRALEVRASLGLVMEQVGDAFDEEFRKLVSQPVSDYQWNEVVAAYTGWKDAKEGRSLTMATNKRDALNDLYRNDERAAPWKGSAYGVLAAFNTASHHVFGADKSRTERNQDRVIDGYYDDFDRNILRMLASV